MCFDKPQPVNAGTTMGETLDAQIKYAPQVYASNATYSPLYTQLGLSNLSSFLKGSNGAPGYLDQYQNDIMPALTNSANSANSAVRASTLADALKLSPQIIAGERAANPGAAGLLDTLTSNSSRDLSYGTELTPSEKVQLNQSVRGGAAARGMGTGPSDVFNESMANTGMGQQLYQNRTATAQNLVPTLQSFYGNPVSQVAGMGSSAGSTAAGITGAANGVMSPAMLSEFNPESTTNSALMSQGYAASEASAMNNNQWAKPFTSY